MTSFQRKNLELITDELAKDEFSDQQLKAVNELMYTATETGLLDIEGYSMKDIIRIYNIVVLGRVVTEDEMKLMRM